ncbi:MAG: hypothetical protein GC180_11560 [Bacteroidetes bacterium]|nr:hypothetical protein [Bacteroidota bacterium]
MKKLSILTFVLFTLLACSKSDTPVPSSGGNNGGNNSGNNASWVDTLSRKWIVYEAYHNGTPDGSSSGLVLDMKNDGSYKLVNTGYVGTWEFEENYTKVRIDKGNSSYETLWTIESISSTLLKVKFISPFTGGNAEWTLKPQP